MRAALLVLVVTFSMNLAGSEVASAVSSVGELIEGVKCRADPTQTYTLYLPTKFDPKRSWPVLLVFDPRGRSTLAAELFREGAEEYGWIIVSSNDTRSDGPMEPNVRAINALWPEVHTMLPIDTARIYIAGFSGGAHLAYAVGKRTGAVAGVIACGGRLLKDDLEDTNFSLFGAAGDTDFNYSEMLKVEEFLGRQGNTHRLEIFEGTHSWMPATMARQAVEWMELDAMRRGTRAVDTELVEKLYAQDMGVAQSLEKEGDVLAALRRYRSIVSSFEGLQELDEPARRVVSLEHDPAVAKARKTERKWNRYETRLLEQSDIAVGALRASEVPPSADELARDLRIVELQRRAAGSGYEAITAQRLLNSLFTDTSFYLTREFLQQRRYDHAISVLEVAARINAASPAVWYNLACAQARSRRRGAALDSLERAIEAGFSDADYIQSDPDLESLRGYQRYLDLVEILGR